MNIPTPEEIIRLGLLRFAPPGKPFSGRSGNSRDYIVDARGAGSNIKLRSTLVGSLAVLLKQLPPVEVIGGVANSGTIWGGWLAWHLDKPFANILLDGPRASGAQREIEGDVTGKSIVLVDNWARSGRSLQKAADICRRQGATPLGALLLVASGPASLSFPVLSLWRANDLDEAVDRMGLRPHQ